MEERGNEEGFHQDLRHGHRRELGVACLGDLGVLLGPLGLERLVHHDGGGDDGGVLAGLAHLSLADGHGVMPGRHLALHLVEQLVLEDQDGVRVVDRREQQADQIIALRAKTDKNMAYMWTGTRDTSASLTKLKQAGVPLFYTPDSLARGLRHLHDYHAWHEKRMANGFASAPAINAAQSAALANSQALKRNALSESESKQLIAAWGVPISMEVCAKDVEAAVKAAEKIGYPVVLKADSPDIPHKTEAGVVRLNLRTADEVRAAHAAILANVRANAPKATLNGVLVQEMVGGGVEVIIGVSYDAQLGPTILFGTGGVMVEVYKDVAMRHCPITPAEAHEMIHEVKGAKLLQGFRGKPACDIDALAKVLVNVSHLAVHLNGQLAELDINPVLVLPKGQGVKAVDALVALKG